MPLPILLVLVVGGVAGITLLLHLLGFSRARRFDPGEARAAWRREHPDCPPGAVHLSQDHCAALIETDAGPGLVWAMGADSAARPIPGARLIPRRGGALLDLGRFDAPRVRLTLTEAQQAEWQAIITGKTP